MSRRRAVLLAGCASRPVNPPMARADPEAGHRFETRVAQAEQRGNLVVLAFSVDGTHAALRQHHCRIARVLAPSEGQRRTHRDDGREAMSQARAR
jgi:hypothetical protein